MNLLESALQRIKELQKTPIPAEIAKAYTASGTATSGITFYNLEAEVKQQYPIITPLRDKIPRTAPAVGGGIQANWRAVTGINTTLMPFGVSEGNRGGVISQTTADFIAKYVECGLENSVTWKAEYAAKGFDDIKARAVRDLLMSCMILEEMTDYGGVGTLALGTTPTPTVADVSTGGSIPQTTAMRVFCVALTPMGYYRVAGWNNGTTNQSLSIASASISATIARTNADGSSDTVAGGVAQKSAVATVTTATDGLSTHRITASVTPVAGAAAYAWYWGTIGAETLGAITTINSVNITTTTGASSQNISALPSADNSADSLSYDGLYAQIMKSGSGSYVVDLATGTPGVGTTLTSDGAGGIVEIETAFQSFYDLYRLSPSLMLVGSGVLLDMNKKIIANGGAPLIRFNLDGKSPGGDIQAGVVVGSYLNKITNTYVKVMVHPNAIPGTIMFWSDTVPYPINEMGTLVVKDLRYDYRQIEWPMTTRKYQYGIYFDGVLKNYFPPAFGLIRNIARG